MCQILFLHQGIKEKAVFDLVHIAKSPEEYGHVILHSYPLKQVYSKLLLGHGLLFLDVALSLPLKQTVRRAKACDCWDRTSFAFLGMCRRQPYNLGL